MDKDLEQIINDLPKDWSEIKLRDFRKILGLQISEDSEFDGLFNGQDNTIKQLSVLTGLPVDTLMALDMDIVIRMANKIDFLMHEPDPESFRGTIKIKPIDKVSNGEYITFIMLSQDVFKNLDILIKTFSLEDYSERDMEELSMLEVYAAFFTLDRHVKKYMKTMARKTTLKITKLIFMERVVQPFRQRCSQLRNKFSKTMVGTSQ